MQFQKSHFHLFSLSSIDMEDEILDYENYEDDEEQSSHGGRSRSHSGSRAGSRSHSGSESSQDSRNGSRSSSPYSRIDSRRRSPSPPPRRRSRSPPRRRSRSPSDGRSAPAREQPAKRRCPSPPASRSPRGQDLGRLSVDDLRAYVKRDIVLQMENLSSPLDQRKLLAAIRVDIKAKSLADAAVPNSYQNPENGQHLCGCPCKYCIALESTLSADQKTFVWKVRGLRNWIPLDAVRPDTLLLPGAIPNTGLQSIPFAFCGSKSTLKDLERAFSKGIFLDSRIHSGSSVNSAPHLSSRWVGGTRPDVPLNVIDAVPAPSSRIRQAPPAIVEGLADEVGVISEGARFWKRLQIKEDTEQSKKVTYTASEASLKVMEDLLSIPKSSLDKTVRKYVKDHATLPTHQFNTFRTPLLPHKFSSVAKVDSSAQARENALSAVGTSFNFSLLGAVKLSESVIPLDGLIPELQIRLAALDGMRPPVYIAPYEDGDELLAKLGEGQEPFMDPGPRDEAEQHWLRAKGEGFLASAGILEDIFRKETVDPSTQQADPVPREEYLEVCWRLVTLMEFTKAARTFHDDMDDMVGRVVSAASRLNTHLKSLQETFSELLYPSLGLTAATLQFQRMMFFKNMLNNDFKQFVRDKAARDPPLTDGSDKPIMHYLLSDMQGICNEFAEFMAKKPKDREIWLKKAGPKRDQPKKDHGRGGGSGGGRGGNSDRSRLRSPSDFMKKDRSRGGGGNNNNGGNSGGRSRNNNGGRGGGGGAKKRQRKRSPSHESPDREAKKSRRRSRSRSRERSRDGDDTRDGRRDKDRSSGNGGGRNNDKGKSGGGYRKKRRGGKKSDKGESFSFSSSLPRDFSGTPEKINASFFPRSEIASFVTNLGFNVDSLEFIASFPEGGRTQKCLEAWKLVTRSKWVLNTIGLGITWSWKTSPPAKFRRSRKGDLGDVKVLQDELAALRKKKAVVTREELPSPFDQTFVASYFAVPKKTKGKFRPICNLKPLNRFIANSKFKMESVKSVRRWIVRDSFMISLDLSDAYLSLAVARDRWRFLGFEFEDVEYFYCCLCFGLNAGPRLFTKVLKKVIQFFRSTLLAWVTFYLDDLLAQNRDPLKLVWQAEAMILILHLLGFRVNFEKSDLIPSQRVTYLGFEFDSVEMTVSLPMAKVEKIGALVRKVINAGSLSVKDLQCLMGSLESTRPAVRVAPLHYRKTQALLVTATKKKWPMKKVLKISELVKVELTWWSQSLPSFRSSPMRDPPAEISIWSDAATSEGCGWGGHSSLGDTVQGIWSDKERELHINVLETMGAVNVVEALLPHNTTAAHYIDNTTAVAYVRNHGGTKSKGSCEKALEYWNIVLGRNSWVIPSHIAGKDNIMADFFSRHTIAHHEFGLTYQVFQLVSRTFFLPEFDLFASSKMHVVKKWASYCWTSDATAGDAFLMKSWPQRSYIFPPLPLLNEVVARLMKQEDLDFILLAPASSHNPPMWFPLLMDLVSEKPLVLGKFSEVCRLDTGKPPEIPGTLAAFARFRSSKGC